MPNQPQLTHLSCALQDKGYNEEEWKMVEETPKIFEDDFSVAVSPSHPLARDSSTRSLAPLALTAPGTRPPPPLTPPLACLPPVLL